MTRQSVVVPAATVWTAPDAPRPIDEPAVRDEPDPAAWVAGLEAETRLGLHGRTLTQLEQGEPVDMVGTGPDGWVEIAAPWQPVPEHTDGYHGWVRAAHLSDSRSDPESDSESDPESDPTKAEPPIGPVTPDRLAVVEEARTLIGLRYLWGGMSRWGLDCSGLVHRCYRRAGVVVPRDAYAQQAAATPVPLGQEQPGDLYFFAREDGHVYHVGFVTGALRMLHAPETRGGGLIEETDLPEERRTRLSHVGRFLS